MYRDFPFRLKSVDPTGQFVGLAASYGNIDLMNDTIQPGAFTKSIQGQGQGFPLLLSHDASMPLGIAKVSDSSTGLLVAGQLVMEDPNAVRVHAHLRAGSLKGLSIGFRDLKSTPQADGGRLLKEIQLFEISLCAIPADPQAQVLSVKAAAEVLGNVKASSLTPEDRATLLSAMRKLMGKDLGCLCDCPECLAGNCSDCSDESCEDPACEGSQVQDETLSALRALAAELRS